MQLTLKLRPTLLVSLLACALTSHANLQEPPATISPLPIHTETTKNIVDALAGRHYVKARVNDELSGRVLDAYIKDLDPSRSYFLRQDVEQFDLYRRQLDNTLMRGDLGPAFAIYNIFHNRLIERHEAIVTMLDAGLDQFDFELDEELIIDREEVPWAESNAELD